MSTVVWSFYQFFVQEYFVALRRLGCLMTITRYGGVARTTRGLFVSRPDLDTTVDGLRGRVNMATFIHSGGNITMAHRNRRLLSFTHGLLRRTSVVGSRFYRNRGEAPGLTISYRRCSFTIGTFISIIGRCSTSRCGFVLHRARANRVVSSITGNDDRVNMLCLSRCGSRILAGLVGGDGLIFRRVFATSPRIFVKGGRPLTDRTIVALSRLGPCPCLICRRNRHGSFCFDRRFLDILSVPGDVRIHSETALFGLTIKLGNFAMDSNIVSGRLGNRRVVTEPLSVGYAVEVNVVGGGGTVLSHCTRSCATTLGGCTTVKWGCNRT